MKNILTVLILFFLSNVFSQDCYKNITDCESFGKNIKSINVYDTLPNGKLIARFERLMKDNIKIYKILIDEKSVFYVKKSTMKKIKKSINKNKCEGIVIERIDYIDENGRRAIRL
jgi:hypothetical protein